MSQELIHCAPASLIVLDGAYSARPELADVVDFSVLIDAPSALREQRLAARLEAAYVAAWHARWDEAEQFYFTRVGPPHSFDLVIPAGALISVPDGQERFG
jgi:uridine kinase